MVELRLDGVRDLDLDRLLDGPRLPVIVTCRPTWEGGSFDGSEDERRRLLGRALDLGAEYVDVEWRAGFADLIARAPERAVVSSHDFDGVPRDLHDRVRAMRGTGAAVIKVAVAAARLSDTLPLRDIGREGNAVVIGMGDPGVPTRVLASHFASRWTYAGQRVAPGQLPASDMETRFRFRQITSATAVYGVVSSHALLSRSPILHNAAFAAGGIDAVYVPFQTDDFGDFLTFAEALGVAGASVTIPFKQDALRRAERTDEIARVVGAANTLAHRADRWEATNTDVDGFLQPLDAMYGDRLRDARASVLGAGGAARAAVVALRSRGARVTVHARREAQARDLAGLGAAAGPWPPVRRSWDVLVNATSVGGGAARDASPLPEGPLDGALVYDLTYGTGESRLLRDARAAGCLTLDGMPMLVAQAERQFAWWMGQPPVPGVMAAAGAFA